MVDERDKKKRLACSGNYQGVLGPMKRTEKEGNLRSEEKEHHGQEKEGSGSEGKSHALASMHFCCALLDLYYFKGLEHSNTKKEHSNQVYSQTTKSELKSLVKHEDQRLHLLQHDIAKRIQNTSLNEEL